jgi:hypothetical protein
MWTGSHRRCAGFVALAYTLCRAQTTPVPPLEVASACTSCTDLQTCRKHWASPGTSTVPDAASSRPRHWRGAGRHLRLPSHVLCMCRRHAVRTLHYAQAVGPTP